MTFEEMERIMQFILEQQAQLTVNMAKSEERRAKSDERIGRIEGIQENTARRMEHVGNALIQLTESHERTRESLGELAVSHAQTQESLRELAESHMQTQESLRGLAESDTHTRESLRELAEATQRELRELAEATQGALKELALSQAHSDRRLDALIDIVRGGKDAGQ